MARFTSRQVGRGGRGSGNSARPARIHRCARQVKPDINKRGGRSDAGVPLRDRRAESSSSRCPAKRGNVRHLSRARSRLSLCRATLLKNRPGVKRVPPGSAGVRRGPVIERLGIAGNAKRIRKESCLKMFETFAYRKSKENITFSRKVRQLIFSPGAKRVQPGG